MFFPARIVRPLSNFPKLIPSKLLRRRYRMLLHLILNQVPPPAPSLSFGFVECFGRQFLLMPHEYLRNSQTVDPCRRFLLKGGFSYPQARWYGWGPDSAELAH